MGQAMRVYSSDGPSPTVAVHHILVLYGAVMDSDAQNIIPIQDGRGMEKQQNGFGIGEPGDPMYTLDTTGGQSVAYETIGTDEVIPLKTANTQANGSNIGEPGDPMYTLDSAGSHAVAYVVPESPYLVDAQRVGDFRTYETAPSLCARMGTGGNNVPVLVVETEDEP